VDSMREEEPLGQSLTGQELYMNILKSTKHSCEVHLMVREKIKYCPYHHSDRKRGADER